MDRHVAMKLIPDGGRVLDVLLGLRLTRTDLATLRLARRELLDDPQGWQAWGRAAVVLEGLMDHWVGSRRDQKPYTRVRALRAAWAVMVHVRCAIVPCPDGKRVDRLRQAWWAYALLWEIVREPGLARDRRMGSLGRDRLKSAL